VFGRPHFGWPLATLLALALSCNDPNQPAARPSFRNPNLPISVKVGEEFTIETDYNATVAPAYRRELQKPLPDCVAYLRGDPAASDSRDRKAGSGESKRSVFKGLKPGAGRLVFAASENSKDPDPSGRLEFSVSVSGP
jgi:hypothetical protein